eukprot:5834402-Amphidinium_carterae.3
MYLTPLLGRSGLRRLCLRAGANSAAAIENSMASVESAAAGLESEVTDFIQYQQEFSHNVSCFPEELISIT